MDLEDLDRWRARVPEMSDQQIKEMLRLENNAWVTSKVEAQQPQRGEFSESAGLAGHYEFDPATLDEIIRECEDLAAELTDDNQRYDYLAAARPVAPDDYASKPYSEGIRVFGQRQKLRNRDWIAYLHDYTDTLRATREAYARQEEHTADDVGRAAEREA